MCVTTVVTGRSNNQPTLAIAPANCIKQQRVGVPGKGHLPAADVDDMRPPLNGEQNRAGKFDLRRRP
jgi:hypothetical protein